MDSIKVFFFEHSWLCLWAGIFFGALGTISLKMSHGLTYWKPSVCLAFFYFVCFIALTLAIKGIDISIVYAIWSGAGTLFVVLMGLFLFHETLSVRKLIAVGLIVVGIIGIHSANAIH